MKVTPVLFLFFQELWHW